MFVTSNAWNFIKSIEDSDNEAAVQQLLLRQAAASGFRWVFAGHVPSATIKPRDIASHVLFQEFPEGWAERYNKNHYALRDPVVRHLQRKRHPFTWDESYAAATRREDVKLVGGEAAAFGLRTGYVIPIHLVGGLLAAVSFGACHADLNPDALAELAFAANFAIGHLLRLRHKPKDMERMVTPRERECILWASEGKTDWEISVILGISPPTVAKHLLSARQRLDVTNRAHLIGEAIRQKIIR
ncbi:LuxR family transcriptional regulator [Hyphomicrobiales bacterium]|nr:LuxR family transcriptional regulator [Hyphomicrobiales bacterium]CAH1696238.1 LuxR family transcriptional regulator [Hyphomicrobiales bacterium]